ncbi:sorting nexin-12 isoform X1 [Aphelocoma coerulescens]|uniref:sorting nexin-12 isoform X1 n=1 Tax=Aphelocoma coerulescens TaxID=39617 RepID=UPI0036047CF4
MMGLRPVLLVTTSRNQVPGPHTPRAVQRPRLATPQTLIGGLPVRVSWSRASVSSRAPSAAASASGSAPSRGGPAGAARARRSNAGNKPAMQVPGRAKRARRAEYPLRLCRSRPRGGAVRDVAERPRTLDNYRFMQTLRGRRAATNLPIFKLKESCVRRRYSDFEWLKNELERDSKIVVPPLPGKALKRQLPFRGDEGIFEESFIEERRQGLEQFINKIAGHPLAQNERCLHMFLQEETIDRNYVPGKVRQ